MRPERVRVFITLLFCISVITVANRMLAGRSFRTRFLHHPAEYQQVEELAGNPTDPPALDRDPKDLIVQLAPAKPLLPSSEGNPPPPPHHGEQSTVKSVSSGRGVVPSLMSDVRRKLEASLANWRTSLSAAAAAEVESSASLPGSDDLKDELTTVTAFFNIEEYATNQVQPELTKDQMRVFSLIESPVVGYFDDDDYLNAFVQSRYDLPSHLTVAHKISRDQMWSFGLVPEIERIFQKPDYPKHNPQTVVARYAAAMHAKYEVLQWAVKENPFKTRYFSWLDAGFFKNLANEFNRFALYLPPNFDTGSVAYLQTTRTRLTDATSADIVRHNLIWVAGGFFVAEVSVMNRWTAEYKKFVYRMINDGWMGADYHVIYAGYNSMNATTKIQTYYSEGLNWWYLGNLAREAGTQRLSH